MYNIIILMTLYYRFPDLPTNPAAKVVVSRTIVIIICNRDVTRYYNNLVFYTMTVVVAYFRIFVITFIIYTSRLLTRTDVFIFL